MSLLKGTATSPAWRATGRPQPVNMATSNGTAQEILPAPGVGKKYLIHSISLAGTTSHPYTNSWGHVRKTDSEYPSGFDSGGSDNIVLTVGIGQTIAFPSPVMWPENYGIHVNANVYLTVAYEVI